MPIDFVKYHGIGNDFVVIRLENICSIALEADWPIKICNRNFGIGADGVIVVGAGSDDHDFTMKIINSDGTCPEMCGNGIRCLAMYIWDCTKMSSIRVKSANQILTCSLEENGLVVVAMGAPVLEPNKIPTFLGNGAAPVLNQHLRIKNHDFEVCAVSMGNPHAVITELRVLF